MNLNLTLAIATYRRPKMLAKCVRSILRQKYLPKQIYIIDNDYLKSAKPIAAKHKNIKYFCEPQKGISKARNLAVKKCQTQYLAFVDDDCLLSNKWSEIANNTINSNSKSAFFQGGVKKQTAKNLVIRAQQKHYQNWINSNIKKDYFNPTGLDTKNIIFNLKKISRSKVLFDTNLPVFEDTDFGLQLNKHRQVGVYLPKLSVIHTEPNNLFKTIKKYYFRGKIKYVVNRKWNNFDNFKPSLTNNFKALLKHPTNIIDIILDQSFQIGFLIAKLKNFQPDHNTVTIINNIDKSANGERCLELSGFLKNHNYKVKIIDSQKLFHQEVKNKANCFYQPVIYPAYRVLRHIFYKTQKQIKPSSYIFYLELLVRGKIIKRYLYKNQVKLAVIQYPEDIGIGLGLNNFKLIFDLPTLYSQETKNPKIAKIEKKVFTKNYPVCFHWYSIMNLAKKLNQKPKNSFILNWGCRRQTQFCKYNKNPKIIHIGNLNSPWVNQKLLKKIQDENHIDIYSYQQPNPKYKIKSHGYLKNLSKINQYQFGLITITNDQLRKNSFSAKHLTYLSFGLPVFCPEWRKDPLLKSATIYYNKNNFKSQFQKYSQRQLWIKKHQAALKLSKKLNWDKTLQPILLTIYKIKDERI